MKTEEFKQKIAEYLKGFDLKETKRITIEADGGVWIIKPSMFEGLVEVSISFVKDKKTMKAFMYEVLEDLLIQVF